MIFVLTLRGDQLDHYIEVMQVAMRKDTTYLLHDKMLSPPLLNYQEVDINISKQRAEKQLTSDCLTPSLIPQPKKQMFLQMVSWGPQ